MHAIETNLIDFVRWLFDIFGWFGVIAAMAIESAGVPLPSEIIMPLAGWLLVAEPGRGISGVLLASLFGAIGNVLGSAVAYGIGAWGGRPLLERYGKYLLITRKDLDRADRWFVDHGEATAFGARLLPVIRTFISFPAGIARMPFGKFVAYSFAGAFLWCIPLTWFGYHLGPKWEDFRNSVKILDYPIAALVLLVIAWYVQHKLRELRHEATETYPPTA